MHEVYIELFIMDNLLMNWLLLFGTIKLARVRVRAWKLWLSSVVGTLYCVMMFMPEYVFLQMLVLKIVLAASMTGIAFFGRHYLKCSAVFLGVSFFSGGVILGLNYLTAGVQIYNGMVVAKLPFRIVIIGVIAVIAFYRLFQKLIGQRKKDGFRYPIKIAFEGRQITADALLDTGHSLVDPISGLPVIILNEGQCRQLLPEEMMKDILLLRKNQHPVSRYAVKLKIISISTLSGGRLMYGIKPDSVEIESDGKQITIDALIGCAEFPIKCSDALLPDYIFDNYVLGGNT